MQVRRESLHHRNFVWLGADNAGHGSLGILVDVNPRLGEAVVEDLEMTVYAFGSPRLQIALDVLGRLLRLEAEGVSTKINRVLRFRIVLILYGQLAIVLCLGGLVPLDCTTTSPARVQVGLFRDDELIPKVSGVGLEFLVELGRDIRREGLVEGSKVNGACVHVAGRICQHGRGFGFER